MTRLALLALLLSGCAAATHPWLWELRCVDENCLDAEHLICERAGYGEWACADLRSFDSDSCPDGGQ